MSEMVERVARAIQAADFKGSNITFDDMNPMRQHDYLRSARAAIEAMRVPTDAMLDYRDAFVKKNDALLVWQHQIDEALK